MRLILPLLVLLCFTARSATLYVSSYGGGTGAYSNAAAAYAAASAGDTIIFPSGTNTWTNTLTIDRPLTLIGSNTTIVAGSTLDDGFFCVAGMTSAVPVTISGFTLNMVSFSPYRTGIKTYTGVDLDCLIISSNVFYYGYEQLTLRGSRGVVHNNTFRESLKAISFNAGTSDQANRSWISMAAGTSNALFIESNLFIDTSNYPTNYGQEKIGTDNGGKLVVRYNEFDFDNVNTNFTETETTIMTHGSAAGGVANGYWQIGTGARRGQSVVEVYNNNMHGRRIDFMFVFRGSANLVYSNTLDTTAFNPRIYCYEEEQYETQWSPLRTNWPAEDQVHNTFIWANTLRLNGATNSDYFEIASSSTNFIQLNRDVFLHAPEVTGGSESFTGANGASSTYPTDGSTYPTYGTMTFTPTGPNAYYGYTPYTYPHPLRNYSTTTPTITIGTTTVGTLRKL